MARAGTKGDLTAALVAEAEKLGAALILLVVRMEGRWWVLAASTPGLGTYPDPVELWSASGEQTDAGRAPAMVCEALGQRPPQRWVSAPEQEPELRLAVYWTADRPVAVEDLVAARDRLFRLASRAVAPALGAPEPEVLAQIIESLPVALIFFDCAGTSVAANRSARRLLELRPVDMAPRTVAKRLERLGVREAIPHDFPHGQGAGSLQLHGRQYAASARAAQGPWGAGVVWRIEEVTQARLTEAKLEEAKRALLLAEVSGGIGHEFNNLLSRVMGLAEDIQALSPSDRIHGLAETLIETAERGAHVVRRLMTYAGSVTPDLQPTDLRALVTSWCGDQQGDDLSHQAADCVAQVLLDPALLKVCLGELLKNARQANASEVRIGCKGASDSGMLALTVADDGVGMDAAARARATEPFFTTRSVGGGVGLGLSMVKGALNQWGGRLKIVSEPGKGTTVTMLLPTLGSASAADQ